MLILNAMTVLFVKCVFLFRCQQVPNPNLWLSYELNVPSKCNKSSDASYGSKNSASEEVEYEYTVFLEQNKLYTSGQLILDLVY